MKLEIRVWNLRESGLQSCCELDVFWDMHLDLHVVWVWLWICKSGFGFEFELDLDVDLDVYVGLDLF